VAPLDLGGGGGAIRGFASDSSADFNSPIRFVGK